MSQATVLYFFFGKRLFIKKTKKLGHRLFKYIPLRSCSQTLSWFGGLLRLTIMPYVTNLGWAGLAIMGVFGECLQTIIFSFKQHLTYFYTFFYSHIFSQKILNNNFQFLNTCTKPAYSLVNCLC